MENTFEVGDLFDYSHIFYTKHYRVVYKNDEFFVAESLSGNEFNDYIPLCIMHSEMNIHLEWITKL